jgi:predicted TIM-barrel fold metal-dependent hydrolase
VASDLLSRWAAFGAVDHHCHVLSRWTSDLEPSDLRSAFSEALDPRIAEEHVPASVAYRRALRLLAGELGCEPVEGAILHARSAQDPETYTNRLMRRSGADLLLLDHGFAMPGAMTPAEHRAAVRLEQREIVRLERVGEEIAGEHADATSWLEAVRARLRAEVEGGAVAVKAITAYRASLRLTRPDPRSLSEAFAALGREAGRGGAVRVAGDPLCHALLWAAAEECVALDVPLQVHTGFGDPDEDLAEASPLGLRPLFREQGLAGLRVVLLHTYPYHRAAAYLCAVYPDVYMDLSLTIPLAADGDRALQEALGLCPWTKLLYASDASRLPELYFVAGLLHRQALAAAFGHLVDEGTLEPAEADAAGRLVLAGNARRVYRLG